jgi:hypothetical protein
MKRSAQKTDFEEILRRVELRNADRIMQRARLANRIAKTLDGNPKARAYRVKHKALIALANKFPDQIKVTRDASLEEILIIKVVRASFGLHIPANCFQLGERMRLAA